MKKTCAKMLRIATIAALLGSVLQPDLSPAHAADAGRKSLQVNKTLTAPVIDGKLDESVWTIDQPLTVHAGQGPSKESRFGLLWDNQYLYIGVKADDDNLIHNGSGYWFEQDNINVFLDPAQHQSAPFAKDDMQIGFVYQPGTTTPEFHFGAALNNHSGKDEKKILRAISQTGTGWSVETAIPWDMLNFNPALKRQLGIEISATDRYGTDAAEQKTSYWSAYNSTSFWNDTSGYGSITLTVSHPVSGSVNPVLLEDNFDKYAPGQIPPNWISDVNAGSEPFTVVKDTYGDGRISFNGNSSGKQSRITAPVQWDNYVIEADLRFEGAVNDARWAAIMFRGASNGKNPYNQMAVRKNGTYELAYRMPDNNWASPTPVSGMWKPLALNEDYSLKVRVFDNNVKEYIKAKNDPAYTLLMDKDFNANLLERGKVGFQGDQSKVSFDNLKVTRITADRLDLTMPGTLEALSGAASVTSSVYFSDGLTYAPAADRVKLYSTDETIIKIVDNKLYPLKPGKVNVKAVYANAEATQGITVTPSLSGVKTVTLKHDDGYLLATAGQAIDMGTVSLKAEYNDFTSGTMTGDQVVWTSANPDLLVEGSKIKALKKGVYTVSGQKDSASIQMIVVAKDAADAEYVLYEENFDALAEGSMPAGWTRKEGTTPAAAAVKSGAFEINASAAPDNPSRVLLPEYLGKFGNYKIEADVTHLAANDNARWHSIMYRIQNRDYPYYQMAVRKDATAANGVEFAERTSANAWNVIDRGSNNELIDAGKMYHYTVKAHGSRVQQWIGNRLVVDTDSASAYAKGEIGLQANGSKMKVDNIRVTLQQDALPPLPDGRFVQVAEPETRIALAPSVVKEIQNANDLAELNGAALPATIVLHVGKGLKVTDPVGKTAVGTVESVLEAIGNRMIPAFYVKDEAAVDELTDYLRTNGWEDAAVISDNGELVKRARTAYPMLRGIVDFSSAGSSLTKEDLLDIRRKTTTSLAKTAILPMNASSRDNVAYLQQRMIMVWAKETANQPDRNIAMHQLITAGVNGIVTSEHETAIGALKVYSNNTTLVRKPYIIAHRGMPSKSPENTIESNRMGLESGADFIENDMFLSKDGHLVIIHDSVLQNTTNGTGKVEDHTLEQLKQLNANKPYPDGFPDVKIPTLDEQIDLAREMGRMVMAEIKTNTPAAVDALVRVIKEKDAEDLVDVMSFDTNQLKRMSELMPEMPLGLLTGGYASETNVNKALRNTLKLVQGLNVSFNTSYGGVGKNFMEAAKHRGIIISPWTFNNKNDFIQFMQLGAYGITTDYAYWAEDWAAAIKPEKDKHELAKDESVTLSAVVESYKGTKTTIAPEVVLLDGQDVVEVSGSKITAKKPGTAHVFMRYTTSMDANNKYDIYTQPVSIKVKGQDGNGGNDGGNNGGNDGGNTGGNNGGNTGGNNGGNTGGNNGGNTGSSDDSSSDSDYSGTGSGSGSGAGSGSSGAGGVSQPANPATQAADLIVAKEGKVKTAELKDSLAAHSNVKVQSDGDKLELAAAGLLDASRTNGKTLLVSSDNATYTLPLSLIKLDTLARQLGVNVDDVSIRFTLTKLNANDAAAVQSAVAAAGGKQAAAPVEFEVEAVSKTGQTIPVPFGSTYVSRDIILNRTVDSSKATGVQYVLETKQLRFVPTLFTTKDGKTTATLKRNGNSVYTVIENNKSFADMTGHWAKADVELLANKLVVDGVTDNRFDAERPITRAEFAALLVRALGLTPAPAKASFSDVSAGDWYAEAAATAAEAGILGGYEDGTFRPNSKITREEQAAMVIRAMAYAGIDAKVSQAKQGEILASFKDAGQVVWAKAELAAAIQAGLMNGMTADTLESGGFATRAQSAAMLKRFLIKANFIN